MLPTNNSSKITLKNTDNAFVPFNELETALTKVQNKTILRQEFIQLLLESELIVSSVNEIMPDGSGFLPLILKKLNAQMIVCFTEETRIGKHEQTAPYFITIPSKDFLQRLPAGIGLVINPGLSANFEITPEEVQQLIK